MARNYSDELSGNFRNMNIGEQHVSASSSQTNICQASSSQTNINQARERMCLEANQSMDRTHLMQTEAMEQRQKKERQFDDLRNYEDEHRSKNQGVMNIRPTERKFETNDFNNLFEDDKEEWLKPSRGRPQLDMDTWGSRSPQLRVELKGVIRGFDENPFEWHQDEIRQPTKEKANPIPEAERQRRADEELLKLEQKAERQRDAEEKLLKLEQKAERQREKELRDMRRRHVEERILEKARVTN